MSASLTGEVIVTSGIIAAYKKPLHIDTFKTRVNKLFGQKTFKIFPNPIESGSILTIEIKKAGSYSIQLLDNNSGLVLVKDITAANDKYTAEIPVSPSLAAGMYYIRLVDENKKKQYTDKLIVQ